MSGTSNPVNWFEIPVNELQRAKTFYEAVFKIELTLHEGGPPKMAWFPWKSMDAPGAAGALLEGDTYVPSYDGTMVYFHVDSIEDTLARVEENGGKILNPKMSIGEFGFVGHFEDCEGNRVALHSMH